MRGRPTTLITPAEPGSLADIIRGEPRSRLFVLPAYWTDKHSRLLAASFCPQPAIKKPVPEGKTRLKQSKMAKRLALELDTLLSQDTLSDRASMAMEHVMSTFFPATLDKPWTNAKLDLHFGERIFDRAVRVSCLWTSRSTDTSASTMPYMPASAPVLAYISRQRLAALRNSHSTNELEPRNALNNPVTRLQQLRSKLLIPADVDRDPYIVATLLVMAQAHFHNKTPLTSPFSLQRRSSSGRQSTQTPRLPFHDVNVQVITHQGQGENANFVVYTAVVTTTFLNRLMFPNKGPDSEDSKSGISISRREVKVWPMLGLRERFVRVLLPEIADPDCIRFWDPLVESGRKRKREGTSSSEEQTPPRASPLRSGRRPFCR
ncbi:hypothetical protein C8A00DRAFT_37003 [Chaetomidium leptoderma]|uniref:Uncharacterized protein n=1 Tax=Chaetomidium leptoderma TaxID=669021 RepID=A0AAN6VHT3_9PEZI|nr:hypothetical protein C8A00DRAFT_37003 [Chaetomidium leptoderma]